MFDCPGQATMPTRQEEPGVIDRRIDPFRVHLLLRETEDIWMAHRSVRTDEAMRREPRECLGKHVRKEPCLTPIGLRPIEVHTVNGHNHAQTLREDDAIERANLGPWLRGVEDDSRKPTRRNGNFMICKKDVI